MINARRLRDCYDSTLPPTRPQFDRDICDRYLRDLSDWIQYLRHWDGAVLVDLGDSQVLSLPSSPSLPTVPLSLPTVPLYDPDTNGMFFEHKTGPKTGIYFDTPVESLSPPKVCIKAYRP